MPMGNPFLGKMGDGKRTPGQARGLREGPGMTGRVWGLQGQALGC